MNRLEEVAMPPRIAALPRNKVGYPIPWFVADLPNGAEPDFRIASSVKRYTAEKIGKCWICGQPRGRYSAFNIGPMCAVNRISSEPPGHRDCALYAAMVCPFLITPQMERRTTGLAEQETVLPAGRMIHRNPGVVLVWITRKHEVFPDPNGNPLWNVGEPIEIFWLREGRPATRDEVLESFASGLPILFEAGMPENDPMVRDAMKLIPA